MTERTVNGQTVTMADVLGAVQNFGQNYHDLHQSVEKLRAELKKHDAESRRDRAGIRELVNALQRSVDKRFDAAFSELDQHSGQIQELQQARTELTMRLQDGEGRLQDQQSEIDELRRRLDQVETQLARLDQERAS